MSLFEILSDTCGGNAHLGIQVVGVGGVVELSQATGTSTQYALLKRAVSLTAKTGMLVLAVSLEHGWRQRLEPTFVVGPLVFSVKKTVWLAPSGIEKIWNRLVRMAAGEGTLLPEGAGAATFPNTCWLAA